MFSYLLFISFQIFIEKSKEPVNILLSSISKIPFNNLSWDFSIIWSILYPFFIFLKFNLVVKLESSNFNKFIEVFILSNSLNIVSLLVISIEDISLDIEFIYLRKYISFDS